MLGEVQRGEVGDESEKREKKDVSRKKARGGIVREAAQTFAKKETCQFRAHIKFDLTTPAIILTTVSFLHHTACNHGRRKEQEIVKGQEGSEEEDRSLR